MAEPTDRQPTKAEEERTLAEATKLRAEALKAEAECMKVNEERRKAAAEADKAEADLVKAVNDAAREEFKYAQELSSDVHHHVYYFGSRVDDGSVDSCRARLAFWRRTEADVPKKTKRVELVFYSPGGSVLAGMALFDYIGEMKREGWHFTTNCRGYAASMAGILLQAGTRRVCGPESYILIHEVSSAAIGKVGELEDEVEFVKLIQSRIWEIFVRRSGGKVTKTRLQARVRRRDFWLDSTEALKLGIVDAVE